MNVLLLDIETSPNIAHVWDVWEQNISSEQLLESSYTLCWSAKWLGKKQMLYDSIKKSGARKMLESIHKLISDADVVVHYNGTKFDIPTINKEFLLHKMPPPAPYKELDLYRVVKQKFRFPINKMDYICKRLDIGRKIKHTGHTLWTRCMEGNAEAWKMMERYNKQDVALLELLYYRISPWISRNPIAVLGDRDACPICSKCVVQKRGTMICGYRRYQRYQCQACGAWFKGRSSVAVSSELRPI